MQSEFEQIETALMVEIIRLRQNPQKTMTSDKLNNVVFEKCKYFNFCILNIINFSEIVN